MTMAIEQKNKGANSFYNFNSEEEYNLQDVTPQTDEGSTPPSAETSPAPSSSSNSLVKSTTTTTTVTNPYSQFKGDNYKDVEDFIRAQMAEYKPETDEEKQKREKRERRSLFLANIANVLGNMHRAFSYQRGVKPMDLPDFSAKARERYDRAQAERDKNRDQYFNYALTLGKLKDADRNFNFQVTKNEIAEQRWQAEQERKDAIADAQRGKYKAAADKDDAMAAYYKAKEAALIEGKPLDIALKEAKIAKENAVADKNRRQGTDSWTSGSGGHSGGKPGEYPWYDAKGNLHYAHSYEAMRQNAINSGTWNDTTQQSVAVKTAGRKTTTTTTTKPAKGHSSKPKKYNNTSKLGL